MVPVYARKTLLLYKDPPGQTLNYNNSNFPTTLSFLVTPFEDLHIRTVDPNSSQPNESLGGKPADYDNKAGKVWSIWVYIVGGTCMVL